MRISDWSSDVCSSDLDPDQPVGAGGVCRQPVLRHPLEFRRGRGDAAGILGDIPVEAADSVVDAILQLGDPLPGRLVLVDARAAIGAELAIQHIAQGGRSEEHTSELQSLMRISYAVFCLKNKNNKDTKYHIFVSDTAIQI